MASVTNRINFVSQPRGGYLKYSAFIETTIPSGEEQLANSTIDHSIQGMAVDYLTRFMSKSPKKVAFSSSLTGARNVSKEDEEKAMKLLDRISGLDDSSIISACKLVGYDVAYRKGKEFFSSVDRIIPSKSDVESF